MSQDPFDKAWEDWHESKIGRMAKLRRTLQTKWPPLDPLEEAMLRKLEEATKEGGSQSPLKSKPANKKPQGVKPPLYLLPFAPLVWAARGFQFGNSPGKYSRGNWKMTHEGQTAHQTIQEYLRATVGHVWQQMERMEQGIEAPEGTDARNHPLAYDEEGGQPHLGLALCSLFMAIGLMVLNGFAPKDPGVTWGSQ